MSGIISTIMGNSAKKKKAKRVIMVVKGAAILDGQVFSNRAKFK